MKQHMNKHMVFAALTAMACCAPPAFAGQLTIRGPLPGNTTALSSEVARWPFDVVVTYDPTATDKGEFARQMQNMAGGSDMVVAMGVAPAVRHLAVYCSNAVRVNCIGLHQRMVPYARNDDFVGGFIAVGQEIARQLPQPVAAAPRPVAAQPVATQPQPQPQPDSGGGAGWIVFGVLLGLVAFVGVATLFLKRQREFNATISRGAALNDFERATSSDGWTRLSEEPAVRRAPAPRPTATTRATPAPAPAPTTVVHTTSTGPNLVDYMIVDSLLHHNHDYTPPAPRNPTPPPRAPTPPRRRPSTPAYSSGSSGSWGSSWSGDSGGDSWGGDSGGSSGSSGDY